MSAPSLSRIENATLAAWRPRVIHHEFGWAMLASGGHTGRLNAIWPLAWDDTTDVQTAILQAETFAKTQGIAPVFRLVAGAFAPLGLDDLLRTRGYRPTQDSLIMVSSLEDARPILDAPALVQANRLDEPFADLVRTAGHSAPDAAERIAALQRVPHAGAHFVRHGEAAVGLGVTDEDLVGIFAMRVAPSQRRRGLGRQILTQLLATAQHKGARLAYLQVEADNAPAIALYEQAGFRVLAGYHYWRRQA